MDTFDKKSVFSFANEKVNGKAEYSVSLKENQQDKISEYREGQLDKIAKGKNGKRVGNSFKYVFDDINDRNAFLEKIADYIRIGEKAKLREQDSYNRQHSADMQGASFYAELDEVPKIPHNKQTSTEKLLSDSTGCFLTLINHLCGGKRENSGRSPFRQLLNHLCGGKL